MGFYEYLITEVTLNKRDINSDIDGFINDYLEKLHPLFQKMFTKFQNDIIQLRPDVKDTIKNWWGNVRKFGNDVWTGKYNTGKYVDHQVYNAKLYNLVETYATALCNESNVNKIDDLLNQFYKNITLIMREGMKKIAQYAINNGYELGYAAARKSVKSTDKPEPELKPELKPVESPKSSRPRPYISKADAEAAVDPTKSTNWTSSISTLD